MDRVRVPLWTAIFGGLLAISDSGSVRATQVDIVGPPGSMAFGRSVTALPNGNFVVIDPYGRILRSARLGTAAVFDSPLPAALQPTPYSRWGELFFALLLACSLGGWLTACRLEVNPLS